MSKTKTPVQTTRLALKELSKEKKPKVRTRESIDRLETAREDKVQKLKDAREAIPLHFEGSLNGDNPELFSKLLLAITESIEQSSIGTQKVNARKLAAAVKMDDELLAVFNPEFTVDTRVDDLSFWQVVLKGMQDSLTHIGRKGFQGLTQPKLSRKQIEARFVKDLECLKVSINGIEHWIRIPAYLASTNPNPAKKSNDATTFATRRGYDRYFS